MHDEGWTRKMIVPDYRVVIAHSHELGMLTHDEQKVNVHEELVVQ